MNDKATSEKEVVTNLQLASHVSRDVALESIVLKSAHLDVPSPDVDLTRMGVKNQFRARYEFAAKSSQLRVLIAFVLDLELPEEPAKSILHLGAEYSVAYRVPEGREYSALELENFAELNGALNVWPYWRELVHTVVARAGLGSITLPVFRAVPKVIDGPIRGRKSMKRKDKEKKGK